MSLMIPDGKLATILGPSGSGKTTLLRCIAGVEDPDAGVINIGTTTVFDSDKGINVPPEDRGVGMVFQSNALWPHLTVKRNVSFPLEIRGDRDWEQKALEALDLLKIKGLADRYPSEISGGEQQRVAMARAMVYRPSLVLLDEPFSSLDAPLRESLRDELRQLQLRMGMTMLYVTHERVDALSLGDSMIVLSEGRVMAFGTPESLIAHPPNAYCAVFVAGMIAVDAEAFLVPSGVRVSTSFGTFELKGESQAAGTAKLCIPPSALELTEEAEGSIPGVAAGTVRRPTGAAGVRVSTQGGVVELIVHGGGPLPAPGEKVFMRVDPSRCMVLPS